MPQRTTEGPMTSTAIEDREAASAPSAAASDPLEAKARLQRRVALVTVGLPMVGTVAAVAIAAVYGIGWLEIGLLAFMYVLTSFGVEVGMHRFFSHRAFKAGPVMTSIIGALGSMGAQGPVLFWAAVHRKHHAFTDRPGDPHSPKLHGSGLVNGLRGWWHAHVGWLFVVDDTDWSKYVPDLFRDRLTFRLNQLYPVFVLAGLALPAALGGLIAGSWAGAGLGLLWGGFVRAFLVDQFTWSVNSFAHLFGRQPHNTRSNSRNLAWLSLPTIGGGWHNNHHAYPALARTSQSLWQLDPGGWSIELLAALGLVTDVRRPKARRGAAG